MDAYMDIYTRYEAEVKALVPELRAWWEGLTDRSWAEGTLAERWPFSFCAHPRFVEVYRRYFMEVSIRTLDLEDAEGDADLSVTEDMWGQPKEEKETPEIVYQPHAILRDHFLVNNKDLIPNFGRFLYVPVGVDDQILINGARDADPS